MTTAAVAMLGPMHWPRFRFEPSMRTGAKPRGTGHARGGDAFAGGVRSGRDFSGVTVERGWSTSTRCLRSLRIQEAVRELLGIARGAGLVGLAGVRPGTLMADPAVRRAYRRGKSTVIGKQRLATLNRLGLSVETRSVDQDLRGSELCGSW